MKYINLSFLIILLLCSSTFCSHLRKKIKQDQTNQTDQIDQIDQCNPVIMQKRVDGKFVSENIEGSARTSMYPEDYQKSKKTIDKALYQTEIARLLLENPKREAKTQMQKAAAKFLTVFVKLKFDTKDSVLLNTKFNRQIKDSGSSWASKVRITGTATGNSMFATVDKIFKGTANATDRVGCLALIGDTGTAIMDYVVGVDNPENKAYGEVFDAMADVTVSEPNKVLEKSEKLDMLEKIRTRLYKSFGGSAIAPNKKTERGLCKNLFQGGAPFKLDGRKGIFNLGDKADREAGIEHGLANTSWPWQAVPKTLMDNCNNEPFAGHFSGSIVELLMVLDLLTWDTEEEEDASFSSPDVWLNESTENIRRRLSSPSRKAKAALASAVLVGLGFHSCVEISPTVRNYLGDYIDKERPNKDNVCKPGQNQTKYITDLMKLFI